MYKSLKDRYLFHRFGQLKGQGLGIFSSCRRIEAQPGLYPLHKVTTDQANYEVFSGVNSFATGTGVSLREALIASLGEGVERYAMPFFDYSSFTIDTIDGLRSLKKSPVDEKYLSVVPHEMPIEGKTVFAPFSGDQRYPWISIERRSDGSKSYLPLDFLGGGFKPTRETPLLCRATTSGVAAGETFQEALLGGVLELIERDAFMLFWWRKAKAKIIDPVTVCRLDSRLADFERWSDKLTLLDMTSDLGVPVVVALIQGENKKGEPAIVVGGACKWTYSEASSKAISEAFSIFFNATRWHQQRIQKSWSSDYDHDIKDFTDTISFYHRDENRSQVIESIVSIADSIVPENQLPQDICAHEKLNLIDKRLKFLGLESIFFLDSSLRDLNRRGFFVVRAFIPGLIPLNLSHLDRPWGMSRLYGEFRGHDSLEGKVRMQDLNQAPHPYP